LEAGRLVPNNKAGLSRPFSYTYMRFRNYLENAKSRPSHARPPANVYSIFRGGKWGADFQTAMI
jgi:hypothetical protein